MSMSIRDPRLPNTYAKAAEFLENEDERKACNNTQVIRRDEHTIAVQLHATDVVTFTDCGSIILNTGGYHTVTTKQRLNAFTPSSVIVYQEDYEWFVVLDRDWDNPYDYVEGFMVNESALAFI